MVNGKRGRGPMGPEERQRLSETMKASPNVREAAERRRGVKRGALSDETRAKMSAAKHALPNTVQWQQWYEHYLHHLEYYREYEQRIKIIREEVPV